MKKITVMRDGSPATKEELECAVSGKPLPPLTGSAMSLQCPQCGGKRDNHRGWCSRPPMMMLPDSPATDELGRRVDNQLSHIEAYAKCLDGLLSDGGARIPGSGMDSCRDAGDIRRVVQHYLRENKRLRATINRYEEKWVDENV